MGLESSKRVKTCNKLDIALETKVENKSKIVAVRHTSTEMTPVSAGSASFASFVQATENKSNPQIFVPDIDKLLQRDTYLKSHEKEIRRR